MITKINKSIFLYIAVITIGLFAVSCDQEDNDGYSTFIPTSPSLTVTTSVSNKTLIEDDSEYQFTATLSTAQLVDIKLKVFQIGGNATSGADYTVDGSLTIPAGSLSATGKIKILSDDLVEDKETVKIQIGDNTTANALLTPATMEFTILNYEDGDLAIDLSWAMSETTTDSSGEEIDPTDFADMRLVISSAPNNTDEIDNADGSSFESYVLNSDVPDGDYYVVADFYAANEEIIRTLDLDLTFNQAGLINDENYVFEGAIDNELICEANFFVLAKIIKSGESYTIEEVGINNFKNNEIIWGGTDVKDFYAPDGWPSHVITGIDCEGLLVISGLNQEWIYEVWGETIQQEGVVHYTIDTEGVVTIEEQYIFTTLYSGALYDYTVSGTGTYDEATGELNIQYNLFQDGWSVDGYWFGAGGLTTPYFEANLIKE